MAFLDKIFGDPSSRYIKTILPIVEAINKLEPEIKSLSNEQIKQKTLEFKERIAKGESLDSILPEAFALVRETSMRTLGQRHFDVQLLGGIVMHQGGIAEMRTGEGKTLVATLPVYLNALFEKGVHVITVNDYLSKRDAVWMGQIYAALGLSVGVIAHESSFLYSEEVRKTRVESTDKERDEKGEFHIVNDFLVPCSRIEAYDADITYGTNSEFGFDYLRDNLEYEPSRVRQKRHYFAVIDEIDSILIDEARTPLIISAPSNESDFIYKKFARVAASLIKDIDYTVDEKMRSIFLTDEGISKSESILGVSNIYAEGGVKMVHHLETAVKAKALYNKDKEYVVKDNEIIIVDPYTGRLQPGRRWSEGLHQAIEAKEGVAIQRETKTFASITYQNYFRMYEKLSGMTGTAATSSEEFYKVYRLNTVTIPTNRPVRRIDHDDLIFQTEKGKLMAIARKVKELRDKGQPVLIGTISIEKNELVGEFLKREGVSFEMLNAKNHEREAEILAQAGRKGAVTVATNMAGRGVDIKLGGNPASQEDAEFVKNAGGLFVLGTERHDARRIDNQLRGRSGRQGDPGETQFFVSMEDHIMRVFAADTVKKMMGRLGIPEDEAIQNSLISKSLESAQSKIEGLNFDARRHILEYDDVLNFQRKIFYERRRNILFGNQSEILSYFESITSPKKTSTGTDELLPEIKTALDEKRRLISESEFAIKLKNIILQSFDMFWIEHLEAMDYLRSSVNLRAYGQRDPLVEYKKEGLRMFKQMEESIQNTIIQSVISLDISSTANSQSEIEKQANRITAGGQQEKNNLLNAHYVKFETGQKYKDVGRNDPCPCGAINPETGKIYKYKNCGLINATYHRKL